EVAGEAGRRGYASPIHGEVAGEAGRRGYASPIHGEVAGEAGRRGYASPIHGEVAGEAGRRGYASPIHGEVAGEAGRRGYASDSTHARCSDPYPPSPPRRSSGRPSSTILPASTTSTRSAISTVESLWAMMSAVRPRRSVRSA